MVRQLALRFIYDGKKKTPTPMGEDVSLTMALVLGEGHKSKEAKLASLSKLSLPFWIVQVSETTSLLLTAFGKRSVSIATNENTRLGEARRILSSEISSADAIPDAVERIVPLLEEIVPLNSTLHFVDSPAVLSGVSSSFVERDLTLTPNRLPETLDSHKVLDISSEYQDIRDKQRTRVETMETMKELVIEKLQGHLDVLENRITLEKDQWTKRLATHDERTKTKVEELGSKTSNEIFALREKHKMDMRALTAEFSRTMADIEEFYSEIVEQIRSSRTAVRTKGEDVESAVVEFQKFVAYLSEHAPKYEEAMEKLNKTSEDVKSRFADSKKGLEAMSTGAQGTADVQTEELAQKRAELDKEHEEKMQELLNLRETVNNSVGKLKRVIQARISDLQQALLEITINTLENDSIPNLAPLTRLDIDTFVAKYENESFIVFTPGTMPADRIFDTFRHQPIDIEFDSFVTQMIEKQIQETPGFKESFENACNAANMLVNPDGLGFIRSGLTKMQLTQLLEEGAKEKIERIWTQNSGQCPKCGELAGIGTKFCPGCGQGL
ncbi:MAG: hypothetical protein P1Q69_14715 [Candidatus Thorarchaeota archaeon]|nr:hypothetical protein [Candidatus Thorarchaeota archaeon]